MLQVVRPLTRVEPGLVCDTPTRLLTRVGPVDLVMPQDRAGCFDPRIARRWQSRLDELNDPIIAIYARGRTTVASTGASHPASFGTTAMLL